MMALIISRTALMVRSPKLLFWIILLFSILLSCLC
jgi:hypothetical protein